MNNLWEGSISMRLGFAGGLVLTVVATAGSPDLGRAMLLAATGAVVSFVTSMLMKLVWKWLTRRGK
ncbi:cell division protein FtsW (lipid II flippase) [Filimonas zeae]|uniref:Uncharacterized protein n=1 Tax=Filimonas zeae TaxID=1737353 RepID=A0A917MQP8_9BACT|nr:hypothetical protein [Filimonas zeae]MDR6337394.1 cell division protein FtsW (lipid II flippase) [Filimonas zeae]GGH58399.1 hypothetical protein GCM10011379_04090 [Filimonas zeae]